MPKIPTFERTRSLQLETISPGEAAAPGRAVAQLGEQITGIAIAAKNADDAAWASKFSSQLQREATDRFEIAKTAGVDLTGFADRQVDKYGESISDMVETAPSKAAGEQLRALSLPYTGRLQSTAFSFELGERYKQRKISLADASSDYANTARQDPSQMEALIVKATIGLQGASDGLTDSDLQDLTLDARQQIMQSTINGVIDADPQTALDRLNEDKQFRDTLTRPQFDALINSANQGLRSRAAAQSAAVKAQMKELRVGVADAVDAYTKGYVPPDAADIADQLTLIGTTDAKLLLKKLSEAQAVQDVTMKFTRASLSEQAQTLADVQSGRVKSGPTVRAITHLQSAHAELKRELESNPVAVAARYGIIDTPVEFDINDPESLQQIADQADLISQTWGVEVSPFDSATIDSIAQSMTTASTDEIVALTRGMASTFSEAQMQQVSKQIAPKQPAIASAMVIASQLDGQTLATDIVAGAGIIKSNPEIVPRPSVYEAELTTTMGNLFEHNPEQRNVIIEAAKALYATGAAERGEFNAANVGDAGAGIGDATRLVLNGAIVDGKVVGGPFEYNGGMVIPPVRGHTESDWEDTIEDLTIEELSVFSTDGLPPVSETGEFFVPADFEDAQYRNAGDGVYRVVIGNGLAITQSGQPYKIDIRQLIQDPLQ